MNKCNICQKKNNLKSFINFGKFPIANFPVNLKKFDNYIFKKKIDKKLMGNLNLQLCKSCDYLQLQRIPNDEILNAVYDEFYSSPSPLKFNFNPTRDTFFLNKLFTFIKNLNLKKVLEIGCYDGYILKQLQKKNYKVIGCEPSKGALIGKEFNIDIINDFFSKSTFPNEKFDLIIMRHTLEHVPNLRKTMNDIIHVMHQKSILSIEVPNIEFYIKQGLLEVFSLQHIHYFSTKAFEQIANDFDLTIMKIIKSPENIIIFFQKKNINKIKSKKTPPSKKKEISFNKFKLKIKENSNKINKIITGYKKNKIAFWGAGGFAVAAIYLYKLPIDSSTLLIDKDTSKHGLYFHQQKIKINKILPNIIEQKKLIIITSYYSKQIIDDIKKLKIKINILQIFPTIKIIKLK